MFLKSNSVTQKNYMGCDITIYAFNDRICINIVNREKIAKTIDFSKMPFGLDDWFYIIPLAFYIDARAIGSYTVLNNYWIRVDNLTYIEELAKEKQLV